MRHAIHLVASILMWVLFSWYWYLVMQRQVSPSSLRSVGLLFVISAVGLVVTIGWVAHNKRIAARNRRRGGRPAVSEILPTDHLGRPMTGVAAADLLTAKVVTVNLDEQGRKVLAAAQGVRD